MQNHPPPSVSAQKQPAGGTYLNGSFKSNSNKQKSQAGICYVNSLINQDILEDGAYLNNALKPKTPQQKTKNDN